MLHWRPPNICELNHQIEQTRLRRRVGRIEDRLAYLRRGQRDQHREMIQGLTSELEALRQKLGHAQCLASPLISQPARLR
ncbi:MAG: hypothetical protein ACREX9_21855 [Gammaproteobacteria bacterium]